MAPAKLFSYLVFNNTLSETSSDIIPLFRG